MLPSGDSGAKSEHHRDCQFLRVQPRGKENLGLLKIVEVDHTVVLKQCRILYHVVHQHYSYAISTVDRASHESSQELQAVLWKNTSVSSPERSWCKMAPSDSNQSSEFGEGMPLGDRIHNFDKLNWKGRLGLSTIVVCGLAAVSFVGVRLVRGLHGGVKKLVSKSDDGDENSLAYDVVAKGFATVQANLGPWSFKDLTLGLAAISKANSPTGQFHAFPFFGEDNFFLNVLCDCR